MNQHQKIQHFAELLEKQQRERIAREYPNIRMDDDHHYRVAVVPGKKYTKIDFDGSGKYMVDHETEIIYGIKAYGVVHRGHRYGTLDTVDEFDWSGYVGTRWEDAEPTDSFGRWHWPYGPEVSSSSSS